jgi:hypothetical protein
MCAQADGLAPWVGSVLEFTYDRVEAGEGVFRTGFPSRERRPVGGRGPSEPWATAYFEYWDGDREPARRWQRAGA